MLLYDSVVNAKMQSDPEFAQVEQEVRSIENAINQLRPRVPGLEATLRGLTESGAYAGRTQMEVDQVRASLAELETRHRGAMANRDALLKK